MADMIINKNMQKIPQKLAENSLWFPEPIKPPRTAISTEFDGSTISACFTKIQEN